MVLANYMLSFTALEEVWFVVSPHNPHKEKASLLAQHHRLQMVRLATEEHPGMKASNIEFKLPQPSYTINTLTHLAEKYPKKEFCLILGMDNLQTFHRWKNYEQILKSHELFVYPRHNSSPGEFSRHPRVHLTEAPVIEVSSSFIRNAIAGKKDVSSFMPAKVATYVKEMNFYKKASTNLPM